MSKIVGFVVGAVLIGIGIATGNVGLIIEGAALIVTQAVVDLTMPKTPAREASEMSIALGEQPRVALFGEANTPGSLVDGFNYGGKYGTDWEVLVIRLADHKCQSLTGFYVNDLYVAYTGDGLYPAFNTDHLAVYFRADTTATALPSIVTTYGPGWTSADVGQSGCDVIVAYRADEPKNKHPGWPGGPPHVSWVVKGKRCYDPRKDSTAGGSGAHRWGTPSTWEWSENPAVCRYNWARGIFANDQVSDPSALLIGRGLTAAEAPPANIFAAANLCDEVVGSGVRYRVAGPVYANQTFIDVEQMFAIACAGSVITHEGDVQLEPGQSKSIVATITDADLLVAGRVSWNQGILSESAPEWVNTVVANYIEPTQQWASHQAPPARTVADVAADGRPREAQVALRLVKDLNQAQRVAEILRRLGRLWGRAGVMLGPRFCELEEGDWINWQSDRYFAGATKTFRIEAYTIDEKWQNSLTLREINASVFDGAFAFDSDHSVTTPTTPPPAIGSPGSGQWVLAAVTLSNAGASVPALEITGSASDDIAVQEIVVEYWKSDGVINPVTSPDAPPWIMEGSHPPTTTKVDITSIQGGQVYYAAVSYVVSGITGDRRVLGPVTAASIDVSGQIANAAASIFWRGPFGETDVPHGYSLTKKGVVITRGTAGSWKEARAESPNVFWDPKIGKYRMIYTGYSGAPGSENLGALGYATSDDVETWTEYGSNPFFSRSNVGGQPDQNGITGGFVWYEDGTYYLFYIGLTATGYEAGTKSICLATSTDFITWTRRGAIITTQASTWRSVAVWHANIVKRGSTYYLFFNASDGGGGGFHESIGYATATTLLGPWTVDDTHSPILDIGASGQWDHVRVGDPYVYRVGETWYMAYYGNGGGSIGSQDGIAYTSDAEFPLGWSRITGNPVLAVGAAGAFDAYDAARPCIWVTPTRYYHWYSTSDGGSPAKVEIALAYQDRLPPSATTGSAPNFIPLVDGSEPPVFITDGAGSLILVAGG
jgi:predicted GH43/DUF377 family glycosyl hydrolase